MQKFNRPLLESLALTLGKVLYLFKHYFPNLQNDDNDSTYPTDLVEGLVPCKGIYHIA